MGLRDIVVAHEYIGHELIDGLRERVMRAFSSSEKSQKLMVTESKDIVFLSYYIDSIPLGI